MNRKTATKLMLVQWSRFQNICINLEGSTLFTGVNGSGKSTILDAMTYLLTGNTQFNKAAKDRDRTVLAYVRGDTKSNGAARYLRNGEIVSYIIMEFWSPVENSSIVTGVCIESPNETEQKSAWFVCRDTTIEQMNVAKTDGKILRIVPKSELTVNGHLLKSADFFGRDRGVEQVLRALGLRCDVGKYRLKLLKMMAFNPENNIDQFIQECVLEPGKVESLKELREQRSRFEHIKEIYENLRDSKEKLEEVERKSIDYESKQRSLNIRELMLCYQELQEKEEEKEKIRIQAEAFEKKRKILEDQKKELDKQYADAGERYRIARNRDVFRGMQESLNELNRQYEKMDEDIEKNKIKLEKLRLLQIKIIEMLKWLKDFLNVSEEEKECLCSLAEQGFQTERKLDAFLHLAVMVERQDRIFEKSEVHYGDYIETINDEIAELEKKIKQLKSNQMIFPKEIEMAKKLIQEELKKEGIDTEVRVFAELVQEIQNVEWRAAIETFLGRKRFHIIVDGKYCHKAMEIIERKKLYTVTVVITDKLPDTQVVLGSAAAVLKIPNVFARRYANYMLNGIHLCNSLEEMRENPKGGLMKNGMLARSYSISYMNTKRTEFCLGQDIIKYQLQRIFEEKEKKTEERAKLQKELDFISERRKEFAQIDWNVESYDFQVISLLEEMKIRKKKISDDIERIRQNPDFTAVLQEQEDAKREYDQIDFARERLNHDIGSCKANEETKKREMEKISGEIYLLNQEYSEKCILHLELKKPMLEEYEKLKAKKGSLQVVTPKAIRNLRSEQEECIRQLENAQLNYCKLAELDTNRRGVAYIPFFREEYRNIANIKIEEAHQRLEEQAEKLENAFMNDFVAEIHETIYEAREEISVINKELKQIPFGNDTYRFVMKERPDRAVFFRICKKLESYMNSPEVYMNSARDDEEMEHDIREFMEMILEEEDETEFTDYRKYFSYDMEIVSRQGENEIVSDLSKKQGSASNGEKQTPYFIILAASLLQCYPKQVCCARLAFIDEAFSALSRERIEQMVKYLEENQFQVFYAAPPEKISSIGIYIKSTVSLVVTGRYTNAVEGLVKENIFPSAGIN